MYKIVLSNLPFALRTFLTRKEGMSTKRTSYHIFYCFYIDLIILQHITVIHLFII